LAAAALANVTFSKEARGCRTCPDTLPWLDAAKTAAFEHIVRKGRPKPLARHYFLRYFSATTAVAVAAQAGGVQAEAGVFRDTSLTGNRERAAAAPKATMTKPRIKKAEGARLYWC
jgi:hypothetical protein